jgi:hypothetical protein
VGDQAVWVWDAAVVDRHHPTDTVVAAVVEVEAFVTDRQRPDLPMAWDVVEMIATVVAIVVDLVDLPHRAIGIEAAVAVDTTGAEEATGNGIDLQVLIDGMEEEEAVVGVDTNIHYLSRLMYVSFL